MHSRDISLPSTGSLNPCARPYYLVCPRLYSDDINSAFHEFCTLSGACAPRTSSYLSRSCRAFATGPLPVCLQNNTLRGRNPASCPHAHSDIRCMDLLHAGPFHDPDFEEANIAVGGHGVSIPDLSVVPISVLEAYVAELKQQRQPVAQFSNVGDPLTRVHSGRNFRTYFLRFTRLQEMCHRAAFIGHSVAEELRSTGTEAAPSLSDTRHIARKSRMLLLEV